MDTLIVPSLSGGENYFITNKHWSGVRIHSKNINNLKYIALYQGTPTFKITHFAKIQKIDSYTVTERYNYNIKYIIHFDDIKKIDISLDDRQNRKLIIQSPRYTTLSKLLTSKTISELFFERR